MKLLRYGPLGFEKPGILNYDGNIRDLSGYINDISGDNIRAEKLSELSKLDIDSLPFVKGSCSFKGCWNKYLIESI